MSLRRHGVMLAAVVAICPASCAQLLGGPFESIDDATVPTRDGSPDAPTLDGVAEVFVDSSVDAVTGDTASDAGIEAEASTDGDAPSIDALAVEASTCLTTACLSNAECASLCAPDAGAFACCIPSVAGARCRLSTTACSAADAGLSDAGAVDAGCTGCWQGGVCMPGTTAAACGGGGSTCEVCAITCSAPGFPCTSDMSLRLSSSCLDAGCGPQSSTCCPTLTCTDSTEIGCTGIPP